MAKRKSRTPMDALWAGRPETVRYSKPKNKMVKHWDVWVNGKLAQTYPATKTKAEMLNIAASLSGNYRIYAVYRWEDKSTTKECIAHGWR
jgi:hypothetical protein